MDFVKYKIIRNTTINTIRKSKQLANDKLAENLRNNSLVPKDWWKTLKTLIKSTQDSTIPPLHSNGVTYTDLDKKAYLLNE